VSVPFSRIAVVVPAAGAGLRFGDERPKQYARVAGRLVLDYTLEVLFECQPAEIVLVVAADDEAWRDVPGVSRAQVVTGGSTRAESVIAGLGAVTNADWAMVHDAARPCVGAAEIRRLADEVDDEAGGLLAVQVSDTVKRGAGDRVALTVDRADLWHAQTPQLFPLATLVRALAGEANVTDESSAIESVGLAPRLVAGRPDNIKVTFPGDLARCEDILARQGRIAVRAAAGTEPPSEAVQ